MKALIVFIGLVAGNILAQWLNADPQYFVALERSYFQGCAVLTYWAMDKFYWGNK